MQICAYNEIHNKLSFLSLDKMPRLAIYSHHLMSFVYYKLGTQTEVLHGSRNCKTLRTKGVVLNRGLKGRLIYATEQKN